MGRGVNRAGAGQADLLVGRQLDLDSMRDGQCHLALERQYVPEFALVGFSPQVPVGGPINQLRRNAHSVARPQHRTFENRVDV